MKGEPWKVTSISLLHRGPAGEKVVTHRGDEPSLALVEQRPGHKAKGVAVGGVEVGGQSASALVPDIESGTGDHFLFSRVFKFATYVSILRESATYITQGGEALG